MAQAVLKNLFVEGFRGGDGDDVVATYQIQIVNEDGSPADISQAESSTFKAKRSYSTDDIIINIDESTGIDIDANNSLLTLSMTVDHLSNVNLSRESTTLVYDWDFTIEGRRHRFLRGDLTIGGDV